jgi:hypothetical protein
VRTGQSSAIGFGLSGKAPYAVAEEVWITCLIPTSCAAWSTAAVPLTSMSYIFASSRIGLRTKAKWSSASIS